ncbi:MAG: NIL domain-containing protein [Acidimicrobiales bacterium]|jgi:ABC-type methionine transport system ATPase subunit
MNERVRLTFPEELVREPVVAQLVRRFDVEPNIRRASVEAHQGWVICELVGTASAIEGAVAWLEEIGVSVDRLGDVLES